MEESLHPSLSRIEQCTASSVRRVAAMLDLPPDTAEQNGVLPRGWHFVLMGADTRRSALRSDGFPGLGAALPDLGLPRLLQGGRIVTYHRDIPIGANVIRTSRVADITEKNGNGGRKAIVQMAHVLRLADDTEPAVSETQTYFLLPPASGQKAAVTPEPIAPSTHLTKTITPDETLLFQFSALGFNSHRIHLDKHYAREVEGFPDLVVNGGLTTLLLTEFARVDLGLDLKHFTMRNIAPLFCGRRITLAATGRGKQWGLKAYDDAGRIAAEMEAEINEL